MSAYDDYFMICRSQWWFPHHPMCASVNVITGIYMHSLIEKFQKCQGFSLSQWLFEKYKSAVPIPPLPCTSHTMHIYIAMDAQLKPFIALPLMNIACSWNSFNIVYLRAVIGSALYNCAYVRSSLHTYLPEIQAVCTALGNLLHPSHCHKHSQKNLHSKFPHVHTWMIQS